MPFKKPDRLIGPKIILEPLSPRHREALRSISQEDQSIWTYFPGNYNGAGSDYDRWFDYTLACDAKNDHYAFAVLWRANRSVLGTTRFYDMVPEHLRLSIGSTWYCRPARGTLVNSEVRLLLLTYAFQLLQANRVELICDPRNLASRAAMRMLGAVQEGIIRNHLIYKDGRIRDSVLFSIIRTEWPTVEERLFHRLSYTSENIVVY